MVRWMAIGMVLASVAGCATYAPRSVVDVGDRVQVVDDKASKRFDLVLRNTSGKAWCIEEDSWPSSLGYLHFHETDVWVDVDGRRYPIASRNLGYCPGDCDLRLPAGESLRGSIPYSEFAFPASVEQSEKHLHLSIGAFVCR
ncbi:hypothetical protein SAMN02800692_3732 [Luteibacter sp. UNC138MFCol5.1]|nr:hypothetical protein SAMN02800692_3732 [Luteibacter sp. UNC138MFCol5.1]